MQGTLSEEIATYDIQFTHANFDEARKKSKNNIYMQLDVLGSEGMGNVKYATDINGNLTEILTGIRRVDVRINFIGQNAKELSSKFKMLLNSSRLDLINLFVSYQKMLSENDLTALENTEYLERVECICRFQFTDSMTLNIDYINKIEIETEIIGK